MAGTTKIVQDGARYLKMLQWDEGEEILRQDNRYGGAGYDSKSRPDLSNTQFFIDALKAAGVPSQRSRVSEGYHFSSAAARTSKANSTTKPWAGKINDGGFIYTCAGDPESKAGDDLRSYGSMTYAGVKSLIYAGVSKDDKRVQAAWEWIRRNYTVERNPGFPPGRGSAGTVLLLPHDGQVPGLPWAWITWKMPRDRNTTGGKTLPRLWRSGSGLTAAGSIRQIAGWKAMPTW
jgi:squalene-hopene/tetraprenyl-beta-curcumene cyclase